MSDETEKTCTCSTDDPDDRCAAHPDRIRIGPYHVAAGDGTTVRAEIITAGSREDGTPVARIRVGEYVVTDDDE